ncbi:hypothetical protein [Streptomyces canus]|uniref:hypothetical protein n=1 Tax=Streptomyces canus TaxID=58343 RepID=UPI0037135232
MTVHHAAELARCSHLPVVGDYKGHPLYCGLTSENLRDPGKANVPLPPGSSTGATPPP